MAAPAEELVAAVAPLEAQLPLLAQLQALVQAPVVAQFPLLVLLQAPALLPVVAQRPLPVLPQALVLAPLEAEVAQEAVELHRSFSAAMAETLLSAGPPRYAPVPRSWRKLKRRP